MMMKGAYLTKDGLAKLKHELSDLKNVKRREIAERIQQAKELGDLSENAEYVEAKNEQGFMEGRILELENLLRNAIVIEGHRAGDTVEIGSTVTVEANGKRMSYSIVGSNEADPTQGRISNESPLGRAFLGAKRGQQLTVQTPAGNTLYTIVDLT